MNSKIEMGTIIGFFIFQLRVPVISRALASSNIKDEIYQAWDAVFQDQMKHWEESSSGDEILRRMLDITSQTKGFYLEKSGMQKRAVFHLFSKHLLNINFLCIFLMNYWWVWKVEIKLNIQIL